MLDPQQVQYLSQEIAIAIDEGIKAGAKNQPTLRDRFAMAALQAFLTDTHAHEGQRCAPVGTLPFREIANLSYEMADAMLEARNPKQDHRAAAVVMGARLHPRANALPDSPTTAV